ncbi:MAG: ABC transporter ATP-binding protein [Acidimicrobiia bacterium]
MSAALELRSIVKRFPGVLANDHISLTVEAGEIRALVGENGAGKSTLMNILYGLLEPDEGEILIRGQTCKIRSPLDAIEAGLGMVHQHFMLFPSLTVTENVVFGVEPNRAGLVDMDQAKAQVLALAEQFNLRIDPHAAVGRLPVGVRQRIEILKMLYRGAEILILDEPTAVLTPQERDGLFVVLRGLAAQGKSVIFITHKLTEVMKLSDRATVLRDGAVTGTVETAKTSVEELCRLMVGRDVELRVGKPDAVPGEAVLSLRGVRIAQGKATPGAEEIDLEVRAGEIVGIAGAAGNGQTELIEAIAGVRPTVSGQIVLAGSDVTHSTIGKRRQGQSHVPEDRDGVGLAMAATVADNLLLGFESKPGFSPHGILSTSTVKDHTSELIRDSDIKTDSAQRPVSSLSGGNRQKLVMGRELAHGSSLLIAEQPTRGVDIGATEEIYNRLIGYRDRGKAILLVSTDLTEILALSDRIMVMFEGKIVGEIEGSQATEEQLGLWMAGSLEGSQEQS